MKMHGMNREVVEVKLQTYSPGYLLDWITPGRGHRYPQAKNEYDTNPTCSYGQQSRKFLPTIIIGPKRRLFLSSNTGSQVQVASLKQTSSSTLLLSQKYLRRFTATTLSRLIVCRWLLFTLSSIISSSDGRVGSVCPNGRNETRPMPKIITISSHSVISCTERAYGHDQKLIWEGNTSRTSRDVHTTLARGTIVGQDINWEGLAFKV